MVKSRRQKPAVKKQFPGRISHPLLRRAGFERGVLVAMTDERQGIEPADFALSLPVGTIIIFRHYKAAGREALAKALRRVTRQRRQILLIAGDARLARRVGADGLHVGRKALFGRWQPGVPVLSAACHDVRAASRIKNLGIPLALVSPVFPTRSHPGAGSLGQHRMTRLISWHHVGYVALGGVSSQTAAGLRDVGGKRGKARMDKSGSALSEQISGDHRKARLRGLVGVAAIDGLAKQRQR